MLHRCHLATTLRILAYYRQKWTPQSECHGISLGTAREAAADPNCRLEMVSYSAQQKGVTLLGRVASLCRRVARARAPITERQLAPTRRLDTSVRTRYRVSQSLQHTHIASQVLPETTEQLSDYGQAVCQAQNALQGGFADALWRLLNGAFCITLCF